MQTGCETDRQAGRSYMQTWLERQTGRQTGRSRQTDKDRFTEDPETK